MIELQLQLFLNLKQIHVQDNITLQRCQSEKQKLNSAFNEWSHRLYTDKWILVSLSFNNPAFRIINVNTKYSQALRKFKLKISICAPTLKNCVVQLFTAVSVPSSWHREPEWMKEVHCILSSAFQISAFPARVSRTKQREQCVGSALPLWFHSKVPVQLMDTVWPDSAWRAIRSLSLLLPWN